MFRLFYLVPFFLFWGGLAAHRLVGFVWPSTPMLGFSSLWGPEAGVLYGWLGGYCYENPFFFFLFIPHVLSPPFPSPSSHTHALKQYW
jgi:hypothetical protein